MIDHREMAECRVLFCLNGGEPQSLPATPASHTDLIDTVRAVAGFGPGAELVVQVCQASLKKRPDLVCPCNAPPDARPFRAVAG